MFDLNAVFRSFGHFQAKEFGVQCGCAETESIDERLRHGFALTRSSVLKVTAVRELIAQVSSRLITILFF